jgi:hypothetical protein
MLLLEVRKMVYGYMDKEELNLFDPLIEVANKGLKELKDKYSFEEAWRKFGDFLYVSYVLLSSEHRSVTHHHLFQPLRE